jgi:hypothetical protein
MANNTADKTLEALSSSTITYPAPQQPVQAPQQQPHLLLGGLAGFGAAALGAVLWAIITVGTHYQIGGMAVGVGWLVGVTVRDFGKGTTPVFGVLGAGLTLLGCLAGNVFAICLVASRQDTYILVNPLAFLHPVLVVALLQTTFSPIDLLFYGLAVYEGFTLSFRRVPAITLPRAR